MSKPSTGKIPFEYPRMFQDIRMTSQDIKKDIEQIKEHRPEGFEHKQAANLARELLGTFSTFYQEPAIVAKPFDVSKTLALIEFMQYDIPKERFTTYEPSDLGWMEYFGLAKKRPRFDAIVLPPGTRFERSECGSLQVFYSPDLPEGKAYAIALGQCVLTRGDAPSIAKRKTGEYL